MQFRVILAGAVAIGLSGCAAPAPVAPPPPQAPVDAAPPPAAMAAPGGLSAFDGVYKPTSSHGVEKHPKTRCNYTMSTLRVRNGQARMMWREVMMGSVNADGTLSMGGPASMLTGQFTNGVFDGKLETPDCTYTVSFAKS